MGSAFDYTLNLPGCKWNKAISTTSDVHISSLCSSRYLFFSKRSRRNVCPSFLLTQARSSFFFKAGPRLGRKHKRKHKQPRLKYKYELSSFMLMLIK